MGHGFTFASISTRGNDRVGARVSSSLLVLALEAGLSAIGGGQASYRNLDAGHPARVEDATPTERYGLDLDMVNLRYDELSGLRTRVQYEPRVSYGIFPRTEVWMRLPIFYRERTALPRGGVAGFGAGALYQLRMESQHIPALAIASEVFRPTGPNALPAAYSLRALVTRSFAPARIHLNASIASYAIREGPSLVVTCPQTGCGSGSNLPPLDGPCSIGGAVEFAASFLCAASQPAPAATGRQRPGDIRTRSHWLLGFALDRTLPLASTLLVADFFAEKFEGLGRRTDLTAELGARHQLRPQVVVSGGIGRHFRGAGHSTFLTLGLTLSRAFQP